MFFGKFKGREVMPVILNFRTQANIKTYTFKYSCNFILDQVYRVQPSLKTKVCGPGKVLGIRSFPESETVQVFSSSTFAVAFCFKSFSTLPYLRFSSPGSFLKSSKRAGMMPFRPKNLIRKASTASAADSLKLSISLNVALFRRP